VESKCNGTAWFSQVLFTECGVIALGTGDLSAAMLTKSMQWKILNYRARAEA
jgi:hypothetical protein